MARLMQAGAVIVAGKDAGVHVLHDISTRAADPKIAGRLVSDRGMAYGRFAGS
jgi:hypothetical protein